MQRERSNRIACLLANTNRFGETTENISSARIVSHVVFIARSNDSYAIFERDRIAKTVIGIGIAGGENALLDPLIVCTPEVIRRSFTTAELHQRTNHHIAAIQGHGIAELILRFAITCSQFCLKLPPGLRIVLVNIRRTSSRFFSSLPIAPMIA